MYICKPCKTSAAYETMPRKNVRLNLGECARVLSGGGFRIVCDARVMLVVEKQVEASVHANGRLIVKTRIEESARRIADEIYGLILSS